MKLQRYALVDTEDWIFDGENEYPVTTQAIGPVDDGEYYRADDVDALLARIRAAVEALDNAWRVLAEGEHLVGVCDNDTADAADRQALDDIESARAALDALLADGGG